MIVGRRSKTQTKDSRPTWLMTPLLSAKEVSKIYQMGTNSVTALDNVSIDVNEGEFVAIQGTSGSGKSTLLNMLGGLDHPRTGEVFFASKPLGPFTKREMARYRRFSVGMIFQNFNLIPTMTCRRKRCARAGVWWFARTTTKRARRQVAWHASDSQIACRIGRQNCLAANSNESRSRERWRTIRRCCWPTSLPEIWIRFARTSCWGCCARWLTRIADDSDGDSRSGTGEQFRRSDCVDERWKSGLRNLDWEFGLRIV